MPDRLLEADSRYDASTYAEESPEALARLFTKAAVLEALRLMETAQSETVRLGALQTLLDRGHGKPVAKLEDTTPRQAAIDIPAVRAAAVALAGDPEARAALRAALREGRE